MKKKAIFSLFVAMLLSFGMMAKSNSLSKAKPFVNKKQNVVIRKSIKEKKKITCECLIYTTTCGVRGIVCGSQFEMMEDALTAEAAFC